MKWGRELGELLPEAWVSAEQALGSTSLRIDSWSLEKMENGFAGSSGKVTTAFKIVTLEKDL